jgi:hypothetical protein
MSTISLSDVKNTLDNIVPVYIIVGFFLYILTYFFRTLRFYLLLNKEVKIFDLFSIVCLHNFFNSLFPARSGELSYVLLLKKIHNRNLSDGIATLVVSRFFDFFCIGLFFILIVLSLQKISESIVITMYFTIFALIGAFIFFILLKEIDSKRGVFIFGFLNNGYIGKNKYLSYFILKMREIYNQVMLISKKGGFFILSLILTSMFIWSIQYCMMYYIALSMQINIGLIPILFAVSFTFLTSLLPVQGIAGFGTTEAGWALGFILMGLSHEQAISTGIGFHLILILFFTILGLWGLIGLQISRYKKAGYVNSN